MNKLHTTDVGLVGDAKATLQLLLDRLDAQRSHCCRKRNAKLYRAWREKNRPAVEADDCITPQRVVSLIE